MPIPQTYIKLECKQIYNSELQSCDLLKDCCPQYETCRLKAELDSGLKLKEHNIGKSFEKCYTVNSSKNCSR